MVSIGVVSLRKKKSGDRRRVEVVNFTNEEIAGLYWSKIPSPVRQVEDFKLGNLEKDKIGVMSEEEERRPKKRKENSKKTRNKRKTSRHRYLGSKGSELIGVRHHPVKHKCHKASEPGKHVCLGPSWDEPCVQPETLWPALKGLFRGIRDLFHMKTSMYRIYGE